jgi:hypothetical protein
MELWLNKHWRVIKPSIAALAASVLLLHLGTYWPGWPISDLVFWPITALVFPIIFMASLLESFKAEATKEVRYFAYAIGIYALAVYVWYYISIGPGVPSYRSGGYFMVSRGVLLRELTYQEFFIAKAAITRVFSSFWLFLVPIYLVVLRVAHVDSKAT